MIFSVLIQFLWFLIFFITVLCFLKFLIHFVWFLWVLIQFYQKVTKLQNYCNFNLNNGITNGERKSTTYHYNTDTPLPNQTLGLGFGMDYAICGAGNDVGRN